MNKKEYEKIQKKEKVKTILKWVFAGLGWTLLATATISLMVVGIKGCANSNNTKSVVSEVHRENEPSNKVTITDNTEFNIDSEMGLNLFQGVAGFTQSGDLSLKYIWDIDGSTMAPFIPSAYSEFTLELTTNTDRFRLFSLDVTYSDDSRYYLNIYKVTHPTGEDEINFFYYNGSYGVWTIEEQDFSYDNIKHIEIIFPRYNFDWVATSNDYIVNVSIDYWYFDPLVFSSNWGGGSYRIASFYEMFRGYEQYTDFKYGWNLKRANQGDNEYGGNTNGGSGGSAGSDGLYGVFGLLASAFTAIASVLSIVVIPGITIGTLIVLPLVVTLIIFIVSMFKR